MNEILAVLSKLLEKVGDYRPNHPRDTTLWGLAQAYAALDKGLMSLNEAKQSLTKAQEFLSSKEN